MSVKPGQNTEGYPDLEQVDEIQNQAKDGKVAIAKADANEPGARLANVTFSIYKEEAGVTDYSGKEVIATLTTNQDGNAISGWLEPGAYVLVEQELPDELSSYERDTTPHAFTITAGETNRTYLENPIGNKKMGRLFVDKVAKFAVSGTDSVTYPLSGEMCIRDRLWDAGIAVVVSAGNYGPGEGTVAVPGNSRKVITVGAMGNSKVKNNCSGLGPTQQCIVKPDLVAPGYQIMSCNADYPKDRRPYVMKSGTSMATPMVAGAIALYLSKYPDAGNVEIKLLLRERCDRAGDKMPFYGWGILNVEKLLKEKEGE